MAGFFDGPNRCDDADFRPVHYRQTLPHKHPVRFIEQFVDSFDVSAFEQRYKVGPGMKGRPPKEIRMMLGVLLYAIHSRTYSARQIDEATEYRADFWFLTNGRRISHDKISDFVNLHEEDLHTVFLQTIYLAHENNLLDFSGLYQDGYLLKADASKRRSRTMDWLTHKERRLSDRLDVILKEMQDQAVAPCAEQEKMRLEKAQSKLEQLRSQLNERIAKRSKGKAPCEVRETEQKTTINETDPDCDLMRQKDDSIASSYLKVSATDPRADIVVASTVSGCNDEAIESLPLFQKANEHCSGLGSYDTVVADSGFTTMKNCEDYEKQGAQLIGPTRKHEYEKRCDAEGRWTPRFEYDQRQHCVYCSQGARLHEEQRYRDNREDTTIVVFANPSACAECMKRSQCTSSKRGYRRVRIDMRCPYQQRCVQRYRSEAGQRLYRKRSHVGETPQGDLKHNGRFLRFLRRGLRKAHADSRLHDTVWNLRRIFNATGGNVAWGV
jgi:transposase